MRYQIQNEQHKFSVKKGYTDAKTEGENVAKKMRGLMYAYFFLSN